MASKFGKRLGKLKVSGIAQWATSEANRKQGKKVAAAAAQTAADRAAVDARNKARSDVYDAETTMRGGLIAAQRGGLASTILNLGGAAGDPDKPYASQVVGTEAAGPAPTLEEYGPAVVAAKRKKQWFDHSPTFGSNEAIGTATSTAISPTTPGAGIGAGTAYDKAKKRIL